MQLRNPIIVYGHDFCPYCKRHSIEVYSYQNFPLGYSEMIKDFPLEKPDDSMPKKFNSYTIYRMRCRTCGRVFPIRYEGTYPVPDRKSEQNFDKFKIDWLSMKTEKDLIPAKYLNDYNDDDEDEMDERSEISRYASHHPTAKYTKGKAQRRAENARKRKRKRR